MATGEMVFLTPYCRAVAEVDVEAGFQDRQSKPEAIQGQSLCLSTAPLWRHTGHPSASEMAHQKPTSLCITYNQESPKRRLESQVWCSGHTQKRSQRARTGPGFSHLKDKGHWQAASPETHAVCRVHRQQLATKDDDSFGGCVWRAPSPSAPAAFTNTKGCTALPK